MYVKIKIVVTFSGHFTSKISEITVVDKITFFAFDYESFQRMLLINKLFLVKRLHCVRMKLLCYLLYISWGGWQSNKISEERWEGVRVDCI